MGTKDPREEAAAALQQSLDTLLKITAESLVRTSELGSAMDFRKGVPLFTRTLQIFDDLRAANLDNVPTNVVTALKGQSDAAIASFQQILQFSPAQANPQQARDALISQVENQYDNFFSVLSPIIAYSVRKGTDFERLENDARTALNEVRSIYSETKKSGDAVINEAQAALEQVRRAALEVGVAQHAIHFKNESDRYKKNSRNWLVATIVTTFVTLAFGGWNIWYYMTEHVDYSVGQSIQIVVAKFITFGLLYYAVVWCGRAYRAQMHNYVINQHRQNALNTFEAFVKATKDDQIKDAVLLQATQSIFALHHSGFSEHENMDDGSPKILEIMRSATAAAKSS